MTRSGHNRHCGGTSQQNLSLLAPDGADHPGDGEPVCDGDQALVGDRGESRAGVEEAGPGG